MEAELLLDKTLTPVIARTQLQFLNWGWGRSNLG